MKDPEVLDPPLRCTARQDTCATGMASCGAAAPRPISAWRPETPVLGMDATMHPNPKVPQICFEHGTDLELPNQAKTPLFILVSIGIPIYLLQVGLVQWHTSPCKTPRNIPNAGFGPARYLQLFTGSQETIEFDAR